MKTAWRAISQVLTAGAPQTVSSHLVKLSVPLNRSLPHRRIYAALVPYTGHVYIYAGKLEAFDPTTGQNWKLDLMAGTNNDALIGYAQTLKQKTTFRTFTSTADVMLFEDEVLPPDAVRLHAQHTESPDQYETGVIVTPFYMVADAERLDFDMVAVMNNENGTLSAKLKAVLLVQEQDVSF